MPTTTPDTIEKQTDDIALALIQETRMEVDGPFYRKLVAALRQMAGLRSKPRKIEKAPENVRKMMTNMFSEAVNFEYRFVISNDGKHATVAINTNCYGHSLSFAQLLSTTLLSAIPVPFKINMEPEIQILGGDRRKGMLSVEVSIITDLPADELRAALVEAGFWEGLEYVAA